MIRLKKPIVAWGFLLPSLIGVIFFLLLPVVLAFAVSLFKWDLVSTPTFIGFDNYRDIFSGSDLWNSLLVTFTFTAISVPISIIGGLILAGALVKNLPGFGVARVLVVIPWVAAPLALGVVWKWIFQPSNGALNAIIGQRIEWLSTPNLALPAVAFVAIWQNIGYISMFFQAGLSRIPTEIYEAATLDGAGKLRQTLSITVPLLRPTTFFVAVTQVVASFQVFDTVYALTGGGPNGRTNVIASLIYNESFTAFRFGRASAIAVILFFILVGITLIQQRYFSSRITYDMS